MDKIFDAIRRGGGRTYLVGGAVRDSLMGLTPKDEDFLVTGLPMPSLLAILHGFGQADLVGQSFGVIKFSPARGVEPFDFALPRKEVSTGTGHRDFDVDYDHTIPVEVDLGRRDFTCNAIAKDMVTGALIDPFRGVEHIQSKSLRLVHKGAFLDDPLRMLRGIQFCARFQFEAHAELFAELTRHSELIRTISPERIAIELCKLLAAPQPSVGFRMMRDAGILKYVLPELNDQVGVPQPKKYHAFDVFDHCLLACDRMPGRGRNRVWLRLTALLHDIGKKATLTYKADGSPQFLGHDEIGAKMAADLLARLKFTSVPTVHLPADRIVHLIRHHMFACDCDAAPKTKRKFLATVGRDCFMDLIRLRVADRAAKGIGADVREWVNFARQLRTIGHGTPAAFSIKDLAIDGNDVMRHLKLKPGRVIGLVLNQLFQMVLDNPELNTRDALMAEASKISISMR